MGCALPFCTCPRQDSNLRTTLRRRVLYPLSYEGSGKKTLFHYADLTDKTNHCASKLRTCPTKRECSFATMIPSSSAFCRLTLN